MTLVHDKYNVHIIRQSRRSIISGLSLVDVVRQAVQYRQPSKQVGTLVDTILYDVWTFSS